MFSLRKAARAVALMGAVAILVSSFAACSDVSTDAQDVTVDSTPIAVRNAAESTAAQSTAKIDMTVAMTIDGRQVSMNGTGQIDEPNKKFTQQFDMKDLLSSATSDAPEGATAPFTVVADGSVVYVSFAGFDKFTGGKPWMKFDTAAGNSVLDLLGGSGGGAFTSDPIAFLRFLQGAGKVTEVGQEDILGTTTTHYSGTYTINDALGTLTHEERDRVTKQFDGLGFPLNARDEAIGFDAWIGDDGLVRRLSTTFDMAKLAPSPTPSPTSKLGNVTVTVDYRDFGGPVDIEIPPPDQVQDLSNLVSQTN